VRRTTGARGLVVAGFQSPLPLEEILMDEGLPSRRDFVSVSGSAVGGAWLMRLAPLIAAAQACASEARRGALTFVTFTPREAADFDAFASRVVPTDDTPGAREAGVVHFADSALETFLSNLLPIIRPGLAAMNERVRNSFPGEEAFADLSEASQDAVIGEVEREDPNFFFFARLLVMLGLVTHADHGGNRDGVGWQLIGFEERFAYQPPFGYYDRDEHGSGDGGVTR
jgi:gluconate 2-dehydrogenase gamma chain